jgi:flagellar basal-body rod protein FlgB
MNIVGPAQQLMAAALEVRSERAKLLAQNVANADTPGYLARDINFQSAVDAMLSQEGAQSADAATTVVAQNIRFDRNDVDLNQQLAKVDDNALTYVATLKLYGDSMGRLMTAMGS